MKRGFSLIEIVQTLILIGLIAGLSISFFKNFSNDKKLYNVTEKLITKASKEAVRQMCTDNRFFCKKCGKFIETPGCSVGDYDDDKRYCTYTSDVCAGTDTELKSKSTANDAKVDCASKPICPDCGGALDLYSSLACPNGVPALNADIPGKSYSYFCVRMHDIINHKSQETPTMTDLEATCGSSTAKNTVIACLENKNCDAAKNHNVDMILPNGARIYGLSKDFVSNKLTIYIKTDRDQYLDTAVFKDNVGSGEKQNTWNLTLEPLAP